MSIESLTIASTDGVELEAALAAGSGPSPPTLLLVHGFPSGALSAEHVGKDLPELAERISVEMGWRCLAIRLRGCGASTGDFHLRSWVDDVRSAIDHLERQCKAERIWLAGFGTGAAVGLTAAADDQRVVAAAVVAAPADFDDWAKAPDQLLAHAKEAGAISAADFPSDLGGWKAAISEVRTTRAAEAFGPRPLLVLHGSDDEVVPAFDARMVADAHGEAELRIISGAGHQMRHDPRAVAVLLGWLDRTRST